MKKTLHGKLEALGRITTKRIFSNVQNALNKPEHLYLAY